MTEATCEHGQFTTEAEAEAMAREAGLTPMALDLTPVDRDHWHDFSTRVYVTEGSVTVTQPENGRTEVLVAGSVLHAPSHLVHRESGDPYRAVVAFDRDPAELTMPVDKDPALLPD